MKKIEYFCQSIRHSDPIEEQMEEAKKGGIIKSYTLTTLNAMNARRNADICLWCDEVWSAGHLHRCLCVPDYNCMFTCGEDFEVFAFVKVSKEGLKPMLVKESQNEVQIPGKPNLFDEVCEPNSCISPVAELVCDAPKVFDELPEPNLCFVSDSIVEVSVAQKVLDEMSEQLLNSNQLEAPLIEDESQTRMKNNGGFDVSESLSDCVSTENLQFLNGHHTFVKMPQANSSLSSDQIVRVVMIGDDQRLSDDINKLQPAVHGVREPRLDEIVSDYVRTAHNLFHNIPVPDFILEMAQAARITQENEEMADAHQVFDTKPEPFFRYQFVFDPGVLFLLSSMAEKDPCLNFFDFKIGWKAKINYKEVHSWGKLYTALGWSEGLWSTIWPLHFPMCSQRIDYTAEVVRLYPSNLHRLFLFVGIVLMFNACELLLVFIGFEEQLTKKWLRFLLKTRYNYFREIMITCCTIRWIKIALCCRFVLTLEDKGDFRGEEDTSKECSSELLNAQVLWLGVNGETMSIVLLTYIFYPGGAMLAEHAPDSMGHFFLGFAHLCFSIVCCNFLGRMAMALCVAINMKPKDAFYSVWVTTDLMQGVKDMLREYTLQQYGHDMTDIFQPFDNTGILRVMIWVENNLASSYKFLTGTTVSFFIFDPGGIDDSLKGETWRTRSVTYEVAKGRTMLIWEAGMLLESGKHNQSDNIFVFDPGGNSDLSEVTSATLFVLSTVLMEATEAPATTTYNAQLELLPKFHSSDGQSFALVTVWVLDLHVCTARC